MHNAHMTTPPIIFELESDIPAGAARVDTITIAQSELQKLRVFDTSLPAEFDSVWVFYPWLDAAVHTPSERTYFLLRTARNRDIITAVEQSRYRDGFVGIAGLSVGSAVLESLTITGGPKRLRVADPDTIEITNLNRIKARLVDVGLHKAEVAAKRAWEIDPFADIDVWDGGISASTIGKFVEELDIVIDEMDSIPLKFALREECKRRKIPVVMGTDNGDGVILDVERFDTEPGRALFHGRVDSSLNLNPTSREEFSRIAAQIINPALFSLRQAESVVRVGVSLAGIPQLGTAAATTGAAVAYAARRILTGADMPSGRYLIDTSSLLASPLP